MTSPTSDALFACLHVPQFPAWALAFVRRGAEPAAARAAEPPLAVHEGGRLLALSAEAERAGLEVGMRVGRAAALCPGAALLLRDRTAERQAWDVVLSAVHATTPFLESAGPPFVYARAGAVELEALARSLGASAACAASREVALLGALRAPRGTVRAVAPGDEAAFLSACPPSVLRQAPAPRGRPFSETVVHGLILLGFNALGPARRLRKRHLTLAFGDEGAALYALLHPKTQRPVPLYRPPPTLTAHHTLEPPVCEPAELLPLVRLLTREAAGKLGGRLCGRVGLDLAYAGATGGPSPASLPALRLLPVASGREDTLCRFAERLAAERLDALRRRAGRVEVDGVTVTLAGLCAAQVRQGTLFDEKERDVDAAVRLVHRRYPGAILRVLLRPGAHFHEDEHAWVVWDERRPRTHRPGGRRGRPAAGQRLGERPRRSGR